MKTFLLAFQSVVLFVIFLAVTESRTIPAAPSSSRDRRTGRFLGLLGLLAGVSNGFYLDGDYSSDEENTDLTSNHNHWRYVPVPYFIPYNSLFFNPPSQYFPPQNQFGSHGSLPLVSAPPYLNTPADANGSTGSSSSVANIGIRTDLARGRLTRQATDKEDDDQEDSSTAAKDEEESEVEEDEAGRGTTLKPKGTTMKNQKLTTITVLTTTEKMETTEGPKGDENETEEEPTTPLTPSTTAHSLEIGEWEFLNGTAPVNNRPKANQTSASYYRVINQRVDPDQVSFTTWYPDAEKISLSNNLAYPFRPSVQYDPKVVLFRPIVQEEQLQELEPPVLPSYS